MLHDEGDGGRLVMLSADEVQRLVAYDRTQTISRFRTP